MITIRFLAVLSAIALTASPASAISDHHQCFKIKDDIAKTSYVLNLAPGDVDYASSTGCQIKVPPKLFCIDVEKSGVVPTPAGAPDGPVLSKSLCYKMKCPTTASVLTTQQDQFGNHGLTIGKSAYLCAPVNDDFCVTNGDCAAVANGTAECESGVCGIGSCNASFDDCNLVAADGCEASTSTDVNNCGNCGIACPSMNSTPACTAGTCTIGSCNSGFFDCNLSASDGCETDVTGDASNCGACNSVCSFPNSTATCVASACQVGPCDPGYGDCNASPGDGCETNVLFDPSNCGSCNVQCPVMNPTCTNGACM